MNAKRVWIGVVASMVGVVGCSQQPEQDAGNEALGITEFQMAESESALEIVGLGADATPVATLSLTLGSFADPEDGHLVPFGRTLVLSVKGNEMVHKSEGLPHLTLPVRAEGPQADVATFVVDPHVSMVLAKHGIDFSVDAPMSADERPYSNCGACTYGRSASCGSNTCGQYVSSGLTYENVCCAGSKTDVNRQCTGTGSDSCGTEGPNGCAVCWSSTYTAYCVVDTTQTDCKVWHDGTGKTCSISQQACVDVAECCFGSDIAACVNHKCLVN